MAENTEISWTDHTFNPWEGCQKISPGCDHCYAEARNARWNGTAINWGPGAPRRRTSISNWNKPLKWNAAHEAFFAQHGHRQRVFCASLADVFDNEVEPQWRHDLCDLIAKTPNLDWLLLTKRIGNVARLVDQSVFDACPNIWLGATVVNQEEADRDIPKLLATPARVRFLSMEPLLGPVDLREFISHGLVRICPRCRWEGRGPRGSGCPGCGLGPEDGPLHWVIVGGESGPKARPMHPRWARDLRIQCQAARVPFHFKQWGEWAPGANFSDDAGIPSGTSCDFGEDLDDNARVWRVGKKVAGRLLDGVTHDGFPEASCSK